MTYITMSQTATANDSRALSWHLVGQKAKASILTPFDFTSFSFVSNTMVERTTSLYQQAQMSSYSGTLQCTSDVLIISLTAPNNITIINYLIPLAPALAFLSEIRYIMLEKYVGQEKVITLKQTSIDRGTISKWIHHQAR
jgi:hypothetical protein